MARELALKITVDKTQAIPNLRETERAIQGVEAAGKKTVLVSKDMDGALARTSGTVSALTATLLKFASAAAIGQAIRSTISWGDSLQTLAQRSGWTVEALQRVGAAAEDNGTSIDAVINATEQLSVRLTSGDRSVASGLKTLGLSLENLASMRPEDRFLSIANAVRQIQDPLEQARVKNDLFGASMNGGWKQLGALLNSDIPAAMARTRVATAEQVKQMEAADNAINALLRDGRLLLAEVLLPIIPVVGSLASRDLPALSRALADLSVSFISFGTMDAKNVLRWLEAASDVDAGVTAAGPAIAGKVLAVGEAFEVAAFNAKDLLKIEQELTAESERLNRAYAAGRDAFLGADVVRRAEEQLVYLKDLTDLALMSPAAFNVFQAELQEAVAYLNQVGDSASGSAARIREVAAAMQSFQAQALATLGGLEPTPTAGLPGGQAPGAALGPDVLQITPQMIAAEWTKAAESIGEDVTAVQAVNQTAAREIESTHRAMTGTLVQHWNFFSTEAIRAIDAVQLRFDLAKQSLEDARANFRAGFIDATVLQKTQLDFWAAQDRLRGFASGGVSDRPAIFGEGGEPEIAGSVDFMARALRGAMGRDSSTAGGQTFQITIYANSEAGGRDAARGFREELVRHGVKLRSI